MGSKDGTHLAPGWHRVFSLARGKESGLAIWPVLAGLCDVDLKVASPARLVRSPKPKRFLQGKLSGQLGDHSSDRT